MTTYLSNLYKYDTRYGDGLVSPMRSCVASLSRSFSTLRAWDHPDLQILAQRVGEVVKHFFATILFSIPAAVGLVIKACQKQPAIIRLKHRPLLDVIDPVRAAPAAPANVIAREGSDLLTGLDPNLLTHIAKTWLTPREQVAAMPTSRCINTAMRSPALWSHFLNHKDFRILGATRWSIKPINPKGPELEYKKAPQLEYTPESTDYLTKPFEQLLTYQVMFTTIATDDDLFRYFARIMKGGPLAFAKVPKLRLEIPCENLTPELLDSPLSAFSTTLKPPFTYPGFSVPATLKQGPEGENLGGEHSFLIGFDANKVPFFALRVVHTAAEGQETQSMIIFAKNAGGFAQVANGPWRANHLALTNNDHLNFLLRLFNNETPGSKMPQGIRLYRQPIKA